MRQWWLLIGCLYACGGAPTSHEDVDGDGFCVSPGVTWDAASHICLGAQGFGDCDDASAARFPGAVELCDDQIDNNCNGDVDEAVAQDLDGDGSLGSTCPGVGDDCDDNDPRALPGAPELCDGVDNDCNGLVDDELEFRSYFLDDDVDGFGDPASDEVVGCGPIDGYVDNPDDCDDADPARNPESNERCNLIDDNCNGVIDDNADGRATFYADLDGDGYGTAENGTVEGCREAEEQGWSSDPRDCDDVNRFIHPDQPDETCDGIDDNCNVTIDEDAGQQDYYLDFDGDGYGSGAPTRACPARAPAGWVTVDRDCDDREGSAYPGNTPDTCDGINNDCDGSTDEDASENPYYIDADGDGFGTGDLLFTCFPLDQVDGASEAGDCDDTLSDVHPDGDDLDCDGVDHDCDGEEPLCPAQAFWISVSRASGLMDLGTSIPTSLSTCVTDESWIELGGYDQTANYGDSILVPNWTHVHVAWEATHVDEVDIPELGLWDMPNVGSVDLSSLDEDFELVLESDGQELAAFEVLAHEAGPVPDGPLCFVVPHPQGLFPLGGGDPVAMPAVSAECGPDPLNASAPMALGCCSTAQPAPSPWRTSVIGGDHVLEFYADEAPAGGRVYRTYGYPTRMETDALLSLSWDPVIQWDLWFRLGLTLSDPNDSACDLAGHDATPSPWFLDDSVEFWNFGSAHNIDPRFPVRQVGTTADGVRVIPYVEVYLPEPIDLDAALAIIEPELVCCGTSCGPQSTPTGCPYDRDGDGSGTWCSGPGAALSWDCNEGDPQVHPSAASTLDCNHPGWWQAACPP